MSGDGLSADDLVARAIQDIIQSVPGDAADTAPVESTTSQPWAETASPSTKNKRPLEELLAEFAEKVAAAPDARAPLPSEPHPSMTFFDRFGRTVAGSEGQRRKRRRRFGGARKGGEEPAAPGGGGGGGGRRRRGGGGRGRSG